MSFFKYVFEQSKKSYGKAILFGILLGLILATSMFISAKTSFDEDDLRKIAEETGCVITNYELTCDVEKYDKLSDVLIDLNYDEDTKADESVILTRENIIIAGTATTYKDMMKMLSVDNDEGSFDVEDLIKFVNNYFAMLFVIFFIGGSIFYLVANLILALVMMALINSIMKTTFVFGQMYKLTIYTSLPYVLFNAITRVLFGFNISGLLPGLLLTILVDYIIIFAITYLVVKKGYEPEYTEPEVVLPFEE